MRGGRGEAGDEGLGRDHDDGYADAPARAKARVLGGGRAHAVELVLDDAGEEAVRARWAALEAGGVPSLARHTGTTHRPHVTVLSGPTPPMAAMQAATEAFDALLPLDLPVSGLGLLGRTRRSTLVELVVPPIAIIDARARLAELWPGVDQRPWLAHLTLAHRLDPDTVATALSLLAGPASSRGGDPAGGTRPSVVRTGVRRVVGLRWWDPDLDRVVSLAGG